MQVLLSRKTASAHDWPGVNRRDETGSLFVTAKD